LSSPKCAANNSAPQESLPRIVPRSLRVSAPTRCVPWPPRDSSDGALSTDVNIGRRSCCRGEHAIVRVAGMSREKTPGATPKRAGRRKLREGRSVSARAWRDVGNFAKKKPARRIFTSSGTYKRRRASGRGRRITRCRDAASLQIERYNVLFRSASRSVRLLGPEPMAPWTCP
jgi:hypothetical protein